MNLDTVTQVKRPASIDAVGPWQPNYAWLAGGTWLFSEPQVATDTLIDLDALGWVPLTATGDGLEIAATCRVTDLHAFKERCADKVREFTRESLRAVEDKKKLAVARAEAFGRDIATGAH